MPASHGPQAFPRERPLPPPPWVLVGLRGAGKTTVGRALATLSGRAFVDLDQVLERRTGSSIATLLDEGEARFRQLEADLLRTSLELLCLGTPQAAVLATGGGVVLDPESRRLLAALPVIYLEASPALLASRVGADAQERPALVSGGPLAEAEALLAVRGAFYSELATHVLDASLPPDEVAAAAYACLGGEAAG
ncbi:MAG: shikimate kinase [Planctomycetes bacterium]|nr:shikimate kinase [Planctomycetota bacterium]